MENLGIFAKTRRILHSEALVVLYNTLAKPYFTYCLTLWGNSFKTYLQKVEILQKKLIRILTFSEYNTHTRPLFRKFNWLDFNQLYTYFSVIHIYKCINRILPQPFWNYFKLSRSVRNSRNLQSLYCSISICKTSLCYSGHNIWNKLPDKIKYAKSLNSLKHNVKKFLLSWIKFIVLCVWNVCCHKSVPFNNVISEFNSLYVYE